jgi:hypothetical protein
VSREYIQTIKQARVAALCSGLRLTISVVNSSKLVSVTRMVLIFLPYQKRKEWGMLRCGRSARCQPAGAQAPRSAFFLWENPPREWRGYMLATAQAITARKAALCGPNRIALLGHHRSAGGRRAAARQPVAPAPMQGKRRVIAAKG